ncbi:MAG: biotin--[acetyl-CoA-carboxylase] ligase [Clostridia bacterium]|nr:biotin--[acetyl-CoA-carboxylase] ligase [Clostridia bacterium]
MSTKTEILQMLSANVGHFVSGQEIGDKLQVSRNAIWKAVESLKDQGYPILSRSRMGYMLTDSVDLLLKDVLQEGISFPCKVMTEDTVTSTNEVCKKAFEEKPLLVVANEQTKGRGRLGRDFYSPKDTGIYMSYAFKPSFGLDKAMLVTMAAAVAVAQGMEEVVKKSPKIKWVNDLYLRGKKIAGILTEAALDLEAGGIQSIVIGIGINCFTKDFPDFERNTPGSIDADVAYTRNDLIVSIVNHLNKLTENMDPAKVILEYKTRCNTLGKLITIYRDYNNPNEVGVKARAYDIDERGGLIVEYQDDLTGQLHTITSGEVFIR